MPAAHYLGLDMGGTNVKAGITDDQGNLLVKLSVPTGAGGRDLAPDKVIARMVDAGKQALEKANLKVSDVAAAGVLAPGQAKLSQGVIVASANLPLWKNVKLRAKVSKGLGIPAVLENDANAAAYGEWWAGAGRGKSGSTKKLTNLFMFTLGTGVGGGLVYDSKVVHGAFDFATEVGHMIVLPEGSPNRELCGCGQRGCLETICSASATGRRATRQLEQHKKLRKKSSLGQVYKSAGAVTAADVAQHAKAGDKLALEVWNQSCYALAIACINVCHFIDPQMIVLAGGMSQAGTFLTDTIHKHFNNEWWTMTPPTAKIALAKLGNDAGVIGAAGVAKDAADRNAIAPVGV
jgi:glucokinase